MVESCSKPLKYESDATYRIFKPVGIFTLSDRSPNVRYRISVGDVIWSLFPLLGIYLVGWDILEPVEYVGCSKKTDPSKMTDLCYDYLTKQDYLQH